MDSPNYQPSPNFGRARTNSSLSVHSVAYPTGIRKRSLSRARSSISSSQTDCLERLALDQVSTPDYQSVQPHASVSLQWLTPQHSPQPQLFPEPTTVETFPQWSVPTPPRSDSGVPTLSIDSNEEPTTSDANSSSQNFDFCPTTTTAEMSSLGFLLPSQYGAGIYDSDSSNFQMDPAYSSMRSPPVTSGSSTYGQTISSSPALYQSRPVQSSAVGRRQSDFPSVSSTDSSYSSTYRRVSNPYGSAAQTPDYSMPPSQTIPSISGLTQSPLPSPHLAQSSSSNVSQYNANVSRSPALYDSNIYGQPMSTAPAAAQLYASNQNMSYPPPFVGSSVNDVTAKPSGSDASIRVLNQRPKPQCWEHGCNGRQFSTFSNLLRHQREKSGTASKSYCPRCGAEFTRTTARNGHLAHDKCTKNRRDSEEKST